MNNREHSKGEEEPKNDEKLEYAKLYNCRPEQIVHDYSEAKEDTVVIIGGAEFNSHEEFTKLSALKKVEGDIILNGSGYDGIDALKLIYMRQGMAVGRFLKQFDSFNQSNLVNTLINEGQGWVINAYMENFDTLNEDTVSKLIVSGQSRSIAREIKKGDEAVKARFKKLTAKNAYELIDAGEADVVVKNKQIFENIDPDDFADKLVSSGGAGALATILFSFKGLKKDIAFKLIEHNRGMEVMSTVNVYSSLGVFEDFDESDDLKILDKLLLKQNAIFNLLVVVHHPEWLKIDQNIIAEKLIEAKQDSMLSISLENFKGLNSDIKQKLIDSGHESSVKEHKSSFSA